MQGQISQHIIRIFLSVMYEMKIAYYAIFFISVRTLPMFLVLGQMKVLKNNGVENDSFFNLN